MWNAKRADIETKYRVACFRYHSSHVSDTLLMVMISILQFYSPACNISAGASFMKHKRIQAMFDRSLEYQCGLACMSI